MKKCLWCGQKTKPDPLSSAPMCADKRCWFGLKTEGNKITVYLPLNQKRQHDVAHISEGWLVVGLRNQTQRT